MIRPDVAPAPPDPDGEPAGTPLPAVDVSDLEEVWHAVEPPYADLFAWLEGRAERPSPDAPGRFRPVMLAVAIDEAVDFPKLSPADYAAEWKWDGIRVQAVREAGVCRLYSRTGDEISGAFPDVMAGLEFEGAIDGEAAARQIRNAQRRGALLERGRRLPQRRDATAAIMDAIGALSGQERVDAYNAAPGARG